MRDRIRQRLRAASPKATAFILFFLGALTTVILDRALKVWVPEGQEGPFLIRVLQSVRDMLSWIRTDWLLIAAATALALYLWEERSLWRERLNQARIVVWNRFSRSKKRPTRHTYVKYADGQILASSNVVSVADEGARRYRINFETPLDTGSFVVLPIGETLAPRVSNLTSASVTVTMPEDGPFKLRFEASPASEDAIHRLMEYLPPVAQEPAQATAPPLPARKALSNYEIDRKLKAIDELLSFLGKDMQPTITEGPRLSSSWWNGFKDRVSHPNYVEKLKTFRDQFQQNAEAFDKLRNDYPEYEDLRVATGQLSWDKVLPAINAFFITNQYLVTYLSQEATQPVLESLVSKKANDFYTAVRLFESWRNQTRERLIHIRNDTVAN